MPFIRIVPKISYFDKCPNDILRIIFNLLDEIELINVTSVCKRFNIFMKEKRSNLLYDFWNKSHPQAYQVPSSLNFPTIDSIPKHGELSEKQALLALTYLLEFNIKLKRGDLIKSADNVNDRENFGIHIFDGEKLIPLDRTIDKEYGSIPKQFKVIDEFPINYFFDNSFENGCMGIHHNRLVWFDYKPYINQLINNMRLDKEILRDEFLKSGDSSSILYTFFEHKNGRKYFIILVVLEQYFYNLGFNIEGAREGFKLLLEGEINFEAIRISGLKKDIESLYFPYFPLLEFN